jgi:hypothetical protein
VETYGAAARPVDASGRTGRAAVASGGGAGRCGESAVVGAVVVLAFVLLPVLLAALAVPLAGAGQRPGPGRSDRRPATTAPGDEAEAAGAEGKDGAAVRDL